MVEEKTKGIRTVKAGNIKPPWEVRELPDPPPLTLKGILQWAGPAVILGALSVGGLRPTMQDLWELNSL